MTIEKHLSPQPTTPSAGAIQGVIFDENTALVQTGGSVQETLWSKIANIFK